MSNILDQLNLAVPSIIYAIITLVIAFIVAGIAKHLVIKLLKASKLDRYTDKIGVVDEETGSSVEFIGKLVYIIVFLLFLPGVLGKLGMEGVSSPIELLVSKFLGFLPNIVAAVIILAVGLFIAKLIRQLVRPILKRLNVDKLQEKAGISSPEGATISSMLSYVIYVLVIIMVITAALQALNISAISKPAIAMLNNIFNALPRIFVAIAIIFIGNYIAKLTGKLLENILSSVGADGIINKVMPSEKENMTKISLSKIIGNTVKYIIIILFTVEAFNFLEFKVLQAAGGGIIAYLPYLISAVLIMGIALLVAVWVESLILKKLPNSKFTASLAKGSIVVIAVFMALSQLGFAKSIVNAAFIIIVGALAVAFAISFGIGGRDFAANALKKLEHKVENAKE